MHPLDPVSPGQYGYRLDGSVYPPAEEVEITSYSSVAILTVFMWAWLICLPEEVTILRRKRLSLPIVAYFVARLACLGNCICSVVLGTNLAVLSEALVGPSDPYNLLFFWITQSTTSLLFLIRIWAVYRYSKYVRYAFCALWTAVAASPALILIGRAPNDTCFIPHLPCWVWGPFTLPCMVAMLFYDTLVFIAVATAIYKNSVDLTTDLSYMQRFKLLICGNGLYKASEMLLKSGQLYYGVTIGVQLLSTVSAFLGLKYSQLIYMIFVPLSSVMACKVFRMLLLCDTVADPLSTAEIHEMFQQRRDSVDLGDTIVLQL